MLSEDDSPKVQDKISDERISKNFQLLLMYKKLQQIRQSCWGRFFRFEKSEIFKSFQNKYTVHRTIRIRLDDIMYMIGLIAISLTFYFLPYQNQDHNLVKCYRYFLVYLILFSVLWLISTHWLRHFFFVMVLVTFPVFTFLLYNNIIPMDPVDPSSSGFVLLTAFETFSPISALTPIFITLYLTYPLKDFIRNKIGSLYSYLFAYSILVLFILWPIYSLINDYIKNGALTYVFITENQALIISFIIIITFSFHLLVHSTFFSGNLRQIRKYLLYNFTRQEATRILEDLTEEQMNESIVYHYYELYTRVMSGIVFCFTLVIEIYIFIYLSNNLSQIIQGVAVMIFGIVFLVYGCILNRIGLPRSTVIYASSIISILPAAFSSLYYTLPFYQYVLLACCLPYTTIYWCIVRSLSHRKPFQKINVVVVLYILVHIPVTLFIINSLQMITTDSQAQQIINYTIASILGIVCATLVIGFIVWICMSIKQLPKQAQKESKELDYNYFETGNPPYIPYVRQQSFSLAWLGSLDIRNLAQILSCVCFISAQLASLYILNELIFTIDRSQLYSSEILEVIQAQFAIIFIYFTYCFVYIVFQINSYFRNFFIGAIWILGIASIIISYTVTAQQFANLDFTIRLIGAVSIVNGVVALALEFIKRRNPQTDHFISGILTILIWIVLILPYAIIIPIASIYIPTATFGMFIFYVILATTTLLIILVSMVSLIFNLLLGKFQEEKKVKYLTEDVNIYLKEEGIQTQDETMHVLYQSYEHRDRRFIYFLKRGFPVRLWRQPPSLGNPGDIMTIVYTQQDLNKKPSFSKISKEDQQDNCWKCLTFCCGVSQEEIDEKLKGAYNNNIVADEQMEELFPNQFLKDVLQKGKVQQAGRLKKKSVDPAKIYSSKTIILKHLQRTQRQLGEQFVLLQKRNKQISSKELGEQQIKKKKSLQIQIWHEVFKFIANNDDPPLKIIYNDYIKFCELIQITNRKINTNTLDQIYSDFANSEWKNIMSLKIEDFALVMEELSEQIYSDNDKIRPSNKLSQCLIEYVYPMLSYYPQFRDLLSQRKVNSRNINVMQRNNQDSQYQKQQLENSPFLNSFQKYKKYSDKNKAKHSNFNNRRQKYQAAKLVEPNLNEDDIFQKKKSEKQIQNSQKQKTKSCKLMIYDKYKAITQCCQKQNEDQGVIKRKNVKPWQYLAVEVVRIMERKDSQWAQSQEEDKNFQFRPIFNNILMALFKFADLYTYLQITIMNPKVGWQQVRFFSVLLLQYRIQLYIALPLVVICAVVGIKGISYILQDRLGLTDTRIPATFPHPMFLFTTIYKLLILALFNTIIMTLLSTFMCSWSNTSAPYAMLLTKQTSQPLECFSAEHDIYLICALVGILIYYPLSAYTMPNFQFAEKTLDLKYRPSYLIIYFQVNFVLAAGKVLLSQIVTNYISSSVPAGQIQVMQVTFQCINIFSLLILAISVRLIEPCMIRWFNYIEMLVILIGLIWNVMGLVLYLTKQWQVAIIIASSLTGALIILMALFIRKRFFSTSIVIPETKEEQIKQLELNWEIRKNYHVDLARINNDNKNFSEELFEEVEEQKPKQQKFVSNRMNMRKNKLVQDFTSGQQNKKMDTLNHLSPNNNPLKILEQQKDSSNSSQSQKIPNF